MINRRAGLSIGAAAVAGALVTVGTAVAGASTRAPQVSHGAYSVPTTMTGMVIRPQPQTSKQGTVLSGSFVEYPRNFSSAEIGLSIGGDKLGNEYAAITTNGGTTWKIGSPALFTATADAPNAVSNALTINTKIDVVYGAECIDVTNNGGATWYRVYPDGDVVAVEQGVTGIAAYVQIVGDNGKVSGTDEYVTNDGGKHWKLESVLGG